MYIYRFHSFTSRQAYNTLHTRDIHRTCMHDMNASDVWVIYVYTIMVVEVSFAKEPYKRDYILQKRPVILISYIHEILIKSVCTIWMHQTYEWMPYHTCDIRECRLYTHTRGIHIYIHVRYIHSHHMRIIRYINEILIEYIYICMI